MSELAREKNRASTRLETGEELDIKANLRRERGGKRRLCEETMRPQLPLLTHAPRACAQMRGCRRQLAVNDADERRWRWRACLSTMWAASKEGIVSIDVLGVAQGCDARRRSRRKAARPALAWPISKRALNDIINNIIQPETFVLD